MRKYDFNDAIDSYFELNRNFNKRDDIAVRKTVSGLMKLIYPDGQATQFELMELLEYAIEGRRRVKEQLKVMAGAEFADTELGYIDLNTGEHKIVMLPEY